MVEGRRQPQSAEKPQKTQVLTALERSVGISIRDYALKTDGQKSHLLSSTEKINIRSLNGRVR